MTRLTMAALLLSVPLAAQAVYQCKDAEGRVTFQERPCAGAEQQRKIEIRNTEASPGAAAGGTVEQRMVAKIERDRRLQGLADQVAAIEGAITNRNAAMLDEMQAISTRKARARNNLAGATLEQSLSTEMTAVAAKYKAMNDVDLERLRVARQQLDRSTRGAGER